MALSRIKNFVVLCSLFAVVTFVIVQKSGILSPKPKVIHHKRARERGLVYSESCTFYFAGQNFVRPRPNLDPFMRRTKLSEVSSSVHEKFDVWLS